ncbi:MAG: hypothetical protein HY903_08560 [Deltaproteobacteria bacterium]|nr:hypothetical protein [Deltaproteobacteria bacterium]
MELGPSGTRFAAPVKVTFRFAPGAFPVVTGAPVYVATYVNRAWERLSVAPSGSDAVAGYTTHFSLFGVVADEPFQPEYLLESSGTDFALAGVSLSSSVRLEMLSMMVAATRVDYIIEAHGAADAEIQLRGLRPSTTLSIFDNAYAHKTLVVTDELGTATYRQALGGGRHEVRGRRRRRRLRVDRNLRR